MRKPALIALTALALSSTALHTAHAQRVDTGTTTPIVRFDPARLYGWIDVPNTGSSVTYNLRLPGGILGGLDAITAPQEARGPSSLDAGLNVSNQVRLAEVRGPVGIGAELLRTRVPTNYSVSRTDSQVWAQLRFFVNSREFTSGQQIPVELVFEQTQTRARASAFVTLSVR
jgi:hypothetical protein